MFKKFLLALTLMISSTGILSPLTAHAKNDNNPEPNGFKPGILEAASWHEHNLYTTGMPWGKWLYAIKRNSQANKRKLKVLAIGDSWFAYPRNNLALGAPDYPPSNTISHLAAYGDLFILSNSKNGSTLKGIVNMKDKISKWVKDYDIDYVLISGGGNDILGTRDLQEHILIDTPGTTPEQTRHSECGVAGWLSCIDQRKEQNTFHDISQDYITIIQAILNANPKVKILTHDYALFQPNEDLAIVGGGIANHTVFRKRAGYNGSSETWMQPTLKRFSICKPEDQIAFTDRLLKEFKVALQNLEADPRTQNRFKMIDSQALIPSVSTFFWLNEIHLTPFGYSKVANAFYEEILSETYPEQFHKEYIRRDVTTCKYDQNR